MNRDATGPVLPTQRALAGAGARRRSAPSPLDIPTQRTVHGPHTVAALAPGGDVSGCGTAASAEPGSVASGVRDHARSEVLHRHARLTTAGRPVFCTPSQAEIAGVVALRQGRGTDGKVIYPTREAAEAAARELEELGARTLRSYLCRRSRSGHFHLATDPGRPVHDRIPGQRGPISP